MAARRKHIKYEEGSWFAVPLNTDGFALGIIVRGSYKTRGGLGYFFGPKWRTIPTDADTQNKGFNDAILVEWFGDLGIIKGEWPLVSCSRPFQRAEWHVPKFARVDMVDKEWGWQVEYSQEDSGEGEAIREILCKASALVGMRRDGFAGSGAVEIALTEIIENGRHDIGLITERSLRLPG